MPLLDDSEVARVYAGVHAERERWTRRSNEYPFFTLGAASYLDGSNNGAARYQDLARRTNPVLAAGFGWVHERLRLAVSHLVGAKARYDERLALPGFHIFLSGMPSGSIHYDLQYEFIDWSAIGVPDGRRQLSLTLAIALPAGGGGLLLWNINWLEIEAMTPKDRRAHLVANRRATRQPYTPGHLIVHSGHQLHQIPNTPDERPDDERITIQAHALPVDGQWIVYW